MDFAGISRRCPKSLRKKKFVFDSRPLFSKASEFRDEQQKKHRQFLGIVPGMGGGQICLCVAVFLGEKRNA